VTREAIARAARLEFSKRGYDRATMRSIAAEAGVDVSLVAHFFGTKHELFVSVMAFPFEPEDVMPEILAGPRSQAGLRLARFVVNTLEEPRGRSVMTGLVRAAASEADASRVLRELVEQRILGSLSEALALPDAPLRASLAGSQVVGLIMARYVVGIEPLASLPREAVIEAIAPNLQRYLTGNLDAALKASKGKKK
jgi:AcrR family transcriptional regulator